MSSPNSADTVEDTGPNIEEIDGQMSLLRLPVVAIVGRPNVGKSTLLNRVVGKRVAIVEEKPKVTRDRKSVEANWAGRRFVLVDTGGWLATGDSLDVKVSAQAEQAAKEADLVLFVVDVTVGITDEDSQVARMLNRLGVATIVVANKVDSQTRENDIWTFSKFGLGDPMPLSALHGRSSGELLDRVVDMIDAPYESDLDEILPQVERLANRPDHDELRVAIVGRPNVGKSTLFNQLIGDERSVTHDLAGTTTDSIDTIVETDALGQVRFIDTAGMRRKSRVGEGTEYYSMVRALKAIDDSDLCILVIDGPEGVTAQDQRLAERIDAAGSPAVVVLNKWDLLSTEAKLEIGDLATEKLAFLSYSPFLRISAKSGSGVKRIWTAIGQAATAYKTRIPTRELNLCLAKAQSEHPPKGTRILYAVQGATDPPTITLFATRSIEASYLRYVERKIRERFGLGNTPIKFRVRKRSEN